MIRRDGRDPVLLWGQDRMHWVEAALAGWDLDAGSPPGGLRAAPRRRASDAATLDVYFDVASPFAYLALTQLAALARAPARAALHPILLGALFRDIGTGRRAAVRDAAAEAALRRARDGAVGALVGRAVRDAARSSRSARSTAQRLCLLAARARRALASIALARALGRAMWAEQRDLEDPTTLLAASSRAQRLPGDWLERDARARDQAALVDETAAARAAGVFGVPTFVVDGDA